MNSNVIKSQKHLDVILNLPVEELWWVFAIDFIGEMADEILLIESREIGAEEIVAKPEQTLVINL